MISNPYSDQLEQQVLCADPIELVGIMFDHLVASIGEARQHLQSGDRDARARSISKAMGLLGELARSLDEQRGGDIARNLALIYLFAAERLSLAHSKQIEAPLVEAIDALRPLRDAWKELHHSRTHNVEMESSYAAGATDGNYESGMRFALSA